VDAHLGLPPDIVRLVAPQTVPKTSSGKIRRDSCKQMYLREELATRSRPAWEQVLRLALSGRNRIRRGPHDPCRWSMVSMRGWHWRL
jgi:hypothetical protein